MNLEAESISLYDTGTKSSPSPPAPNPAALHQDSEDDQIRALLGLLQKSNFFLLLLKKWSDFFLFTFPPPQAFCDMSWSG